MTALDDELLPEILSILNEFGGDWTFIVPSTEVDLDTGAVVSIDAENTFTVKAVVGSSSKEDTDSQRSNRSSIFIAASGLSFRVTPDLIVKKGDKQFAITDVIYHYTGDLVGLIELKLA